MGITDRMAFVNQRPFGRFEAAFYEFEAAAAVRDIVVPVLEEELRPAPAGRILDVGCGGGATTTQLAHNGREIVGLDPSLPQLSRLRRRHALPGLAAGAEALPVASGSCAAVVSSCAVKHWPDRQAGLLECARVLAPDGRLVVAEIDGGQTDDELLNFAARARVPRGLHRLYRAFARRSFVPVSPTAGSVAAELTAAGLVDVRTWRIDGLPFFVVTGTR